MSDDAFYDYVVDWDKLVAQIEEVKAGLRKLTQAELPIRKQIAEAIGNAMPGGLQEGINHYTLRDGRKLKVTRAIDRKIDESEVVPVREAYMMLNNNPVPFDTLLRIKYELAKTEWSKLDGGAQKIISRMLVTKDAAPTVELD